MTSRAASAVLLLSLGFGWGFGGGWGCGSSGDGATAAATPATVTAAPPFTPSTAKPWKALDGILLPAPEKFRDVVHVPAAAKEIRKGPTLGVYELRTRFADAEAFYDRYHPDVPRMKRVVGFTLKLTPPGPDYIDVHVLEPEFEKIQIVINVVARTPASAPASAPGSELY